MLFLRPAGAGVRSAVFTFCPLKGVRMPSMADDVATERTTVRSRVAGLRRYGLASARRVLMAGVYLVERRVGQA